jgi:hypothetical protein
VAILVRPLAVSAARTTTTTHAFMDKRYGVAIVVLLPLIHAQPSPPSAPPADEAAPIWRIVMLSFVTIILGLLVLAVGVAGELAGLSARSLRSGSRSGGS